MSIPLLENQSDSIKSYTNNWKTDLILINLVKNNKKIKKIRIKMIKKKWLNN
jgi:hypothetical protein